MDATYPTCLDTADDATACAFFWTGLALGILHVDASKEWAYARIDARDAPTIEIIEIIEIATACWRTSRQPI